MNDFKINRRKFLKVLGWSGAGTALAGCDLPTTVTLEEGKENVVSYLMPEEYVIPGVGVWYASTCTQCSAGCGLHGRVREGRILKLEGNPDSHLNNGKTCSMGQAGVQAHYNPDRITQPMMRENGALKPVSWADAMARLEEKTGAKSGLAGDRVAWFTGAVSGHQSVLVGEHLDALGSKNHFVHEAVGAPVWQAVCNDMLGDAMPRLSMDKAQMILSFGADFLGTWISPVHFAGQYANFRTGKRGVLVQVESKMTMTGGNADLWVAIRPGTEGTLAMGIANVLLQRGWAKVSIPADVQSVVSQYDVPSVSKATGVAADRIERIAELLNKRGPSLVLAGAAVEGQENGYDAAAATMLLNILLGNVGKTIEAGARFPEDSMRAKHGGTRDLLAFADALNNKRYDVVFFYNANPVYTAPNALKLNEALQNVPFKVALTQFPDETAMSADLVLPLASGMEDWGTHVAAYQPDDAYLSFQQPLMEPIHKDTKGFGDLMLAMLKMRGAKAGDFADYYGYLKASLTNMPASVTGGSVADKEALWEEVLQKGLLKVRGSAGRLSANAAAAKQAAYKDDASFPLHLIPSARVGMWDGRHANLPWIQEAPDSISKVVWDSWAEMHPSTAAKLGVKTGDYIQISSAQGSIETQVYVFKGIHPDAIAVPLGQGHEEYGRYAKGRGVNPLKILDPIKERKTGELAAYATRVRVAKTGMSSKLVKMGGSETQAGRKFVVTVSADVLRRTEGEV